MLGSFSQGSAHMSANAFAGPRNHDDLPLLALGGRLWVDSGVDIAVDGLGKGVEGGKERIGESVGHDRIDSRLPKLVKRSTKTLKDLV